MIEIMTDVITLVGWMLLPLLAAGTAHELIYPKVKHVNILLLTTFFVSFYILPFLFAIAMAPNVPLVSHITLDLLNKVLTKNLIGMSVIIIACIFTELYFYIIITDMYEENFVKVVFMVTILFTVLGGFWVLCDIAQSNLLN